MKIHNLKICFLFFACYPVIALCDEGFSSAEPSIPANIYYRAFTIITLQEECEKSPEVSKITLRLANTTIEVGDRVHSNSPDDSTVSDLVIEAFDDEGNFLPSVPVHVGAGSQGRTIDYDPGVIYKDASMEYWEARKPGKFDIGAIWACSSNPQKVVGDTVTIQVVESSD